MYEVNPAEFDFSNEHLLLGAAYNFFISVSFGGQVL